MIIHKNELFETIQMNHHNIGFAKEENHKLLQTSPLTWRSLVSNAKLALPQVVMGLITLTV